MSYEMKLNKNKVQALRAKMCLSQEELAAACGLSVRTIQRIEKGGTASLETTKALASVFNLTPNELSVNQRAGNLTFSFICKHAWLVAFLFSSIFFGMWIVDILIPTLKGADFNQQYEINGNFRYLDFGGISFFIGFVCLAINMHIEHVQNKKLFGSIDANKL